MICSRSKLICLLLQAADYLKFELSSLTGLSLFSMQEQYTKELEPYSLDYAAKEATKVFEKTIRNLVKTTKIK